MSTVTTIRRLSEAEGQDVSIGGWLYGKRSGGKIVFLLVRDGTGVCQCVAEAGMPEVFEAASGLTLESSVRISGRVRADKKTPGTRPVLSHLVFWGGEDQRDNPKR